MQYLKMELNIHIMINLITIHVFKNVNFTGIIIE